MPHRSSVNPFSDLVKEGVAEEKESEKGSRLERESGSTMNR
jgi:hypothetical protein